MRIIFHRYCILIIHNTEDIQTEHKATGQTVLTRLSLLRLQNAYGSKAIHWQSPDKNNPKINIKVLMAVIMWKYLGISMETVNTFNNQSDGTHVFDASGTLTKSAVELAAFILVYAHRRSLTFSLVFLNKIRLNKNNQHI